MILCTRVEINSLELTALMILWRNGYSFFKEPVLLMSPFSLVSNAFFVLCQDSYWHQTWSNSHFLSEWVSQCCSDGKGEIHACLFVLRPHSSNYFHLCPPISLFFYYSPVELTHSSLLPFHLPSLLSLLILPQNFCLKGLLSDNYKQCLHSHACSKPGHMIITLLFPCLSHSTATVWGCECWTLLSCPLSQGTVFWYVCISLFHQALANDIQLIISVFITSGFSAYCCIWWTCHKQ